MIQTQQQCGICMDDIIVGSEAVIPTPVDKNSRTVVSAPCGFPYSFFHRECLSEWWNACAERTSTGSNEEEMMSSGSSSSSSSSRRAVSLSSSMRCPHCSVPQPPEAFLADMLHFHFKKLLLQEGFWASKPHYIRAQNGLVILFLINYHY